MTDRAPIAIKRAPTADVVIGGQTFKLSYNFRSIIRVKELTGKSLLSGDAWAETENDPALVCAILFGGLIGEQPEITYDQVQDMFLPSELSTVLPKIREAWTAVQPKVELVDPKIAPVTEPVPAL